MVEKVTPIQNNTWTTLTTQAWPKQNKAWTDLTTLTSATPALNKKLIILKLDLSIKLLTPRHSASRSRIPAKITSNWVQSTVFSTSKEARAPEFLITITSRTTMISGNSSFSIRERVLHLNLRPLKRRMFTHRGKLRCYRPNKLIHKTFWLTTGLLRISSK